MQPPNQPFYAKDIHSSTFYQNHRYFHRSRTQGSCSNSLQSHQGPLKQFVSLPRPFGVNHTYQFLRKSNSKYLPEMTHTRFASVSQRVSHKQERSKSLERGMETTTQSKHKKSSSEDFRYCRMMITVYLYDGMDKQRRVEVDLMKYFKGCFLKCEVKLEKMTIDQFRILAEYIPLALESRKVKNSKRFVPRAELGFATTKTLTQMLNKFIEFRDNNKTQQVTQMLNYYILPDDEILDYQLGLLMNEINTLALKQINQQTDKQRYHELYISNGTNFTKVHNIFELDCGSDSEFIVAVPETGLDSMVVTKYKDIVMGKYRRKHAYSLEQLSDHNYGINFLQRKQEYTRLEQLLRRKQKLKSNYKGRIKYKNPLLDIKAPFIDKTKLIPQQLIFQ